MKILKLVVIICFFVFDGVLATAWSLQLSDTIGLVQGTIAAKFCHQSDRKETEAVDELLATESLTYTQRKEFCDTYATQRQDDACGTFYVYEDFASKDEFDSFLKNVKCKGEGFKWFVIFQGTLTTIEIHRMFKKFGKSVFSRKLLDKIVKNRQSLASVDLNQKRGRFVVTLMDSMKNFWESKWIKTIELADKLIWEINAVRDKCFPKNPNGVVVGEIICEEQANVETSLNQFEVQLNEWIESKRIPGLSKGEPGSTNEGVEFDTATGILKKSAVLFYDSTELPTIADVTNAFNKCLVPGGECSSIESKNRNVLRIILKASERYRGDKFWFGTLFRRQGNLNRMPDLAYKRSWSLSETCDVLKTLKLSDLVKEPLSKQYCQRQN